MAVHEATATLSAVAHLPTPNIYYLYPPKFAYESDGTTVVYTRRGYSPTETVQTYRSASEIRILNSYDQVCLTNATDTYDRQRWRFIFPELRDVLFVNAMHDGGRAATFYIYKSYDTTDGFDGTWTQIATSGRVIGWDGAYNRMRNNLIPVDALGVRAIQFLIDTTHGIFFDSGGLHHKIHIYGNKTNPAENSRLAVWHPTLDQEIPYGYLDWGNTGYGVSTKDFRIKNISTHKRAINIIVSTNDTGESFSTAAYHKMSYQQSSYGSTASIGTLQAGQISDVITLKKDIPVGSGNRWFSVRLVAHPEEWRQYIHFVTSTLTATGAIAPSPLRIQNADAVLTASGYVSDGTLFRNSGAFRDSKPFRGTNIRMTWAGQATLSASTSGDMNTDEYLDLYGASNAIASAYNPFQKTTASLSASALGDNYDDDYRDQYGNSGLYAVATVT